MHVIATEIFNPFHSQQTISWDTIHAVFELHCCSSYDPLPGLGTRTACRLGVSLVPLSHYSSLKQISTAISLPAPSSSCGSPQFSSRTSLPSPPAAQRCWGGEHPQEQMHLRPLSPPPGEGGSTPHGSISRSLTYLSNGDGTGFSYWNIKVASRLAEDEVSSSVSLPCLDQREVSCNGLLHDVVTAIEHPRLEDQQQLSLQSSYPPPVLNFFSPSSSSSSSFPSFSSFLSSSPLFLRWVSQCSPCCHI